MAELNMRVITCILMITERNFNVKYGFIEMKSPHTPPFGAVDFPKFSQCSNPFTRLAASLEPDEMSDDFAASTPSVIAGPRPSVSSPSFENQTWLHRKGVHQSAWRYLQPLCR